MRRVLLLLHGREPSPIPLAIAYASGLVAAACAWTAGPGGFTGALLALLALDWTAGCIANATRSTRAYYASKPWPWPVTFVALHAAEFPLLWWLAPDATLAAWMQALLVIKLAVFVSGQAELRGNTSRP